MSQPLIFSHSMDFTLVFDSKLKSTLGISIFRMESLSPILIPPCMEFCIADYYIILNTTLNQESNEYLYQIQTWIGSKAELDKRFCSAMYAVGLKNYLSCTCRILVQYQDEESPEFLELFPNYSYLDASQSSKSALYPLVPREYPLLLYKIYGKYDFKVSLVCFYSLYSL